MTPRDRVLRALTFKRPDRAPRDLWSLRTPFENIAEVFEEWSVQSPDHGSVSEPVA